MTAVLLDSLAAIVGAANILSGDDVTSRNVDFFSDETCQGLAIVRPANTEEVAKVMALCHQHQQKVVTIAGQTGMVKGGRAAADELFVSLERMNRIVELDPQSRTLTVEAGVTMQAVQEAAEAAGFFYPVDLGARGSATIGGNIATNAGGNRVIRFGMTRDQVLGLEVVLADGTVMSNLGKLLKNNTGYDLKQLFVGSEGTLGIVTKAVLRLRPAVKQSHVAMLAVSEFASLPGILQRVDEELEGGLCAFEVMWQEFFDCIAEAYPDKTLPLPPGSAFYVLVEQLSGDDGERLQQVLMALYEDGLIEDIALAQSDRQRQAIWEIRDDVETISEQLGGVGIGYDVSLPIAEMDDYINTLKANLAEADSASRCVAFGHMGDSNLHLAIAYKDNSESDKLEIDHLVYGPLKNIQGSVSAEHGIGLTKKAYLPLCRSDAEIGLMRGIKQVFDPLNIMNPGKIF
ncbi:MAG: FAD-binding oxidoreductase [Candidatus Pelagadaptatus aseana]|uniref:FAD-binding oxidoreductase n=1 Tax=Candidatus Pelagadaptatus aseana TaxID=3120508 RepID=UPI0039B1A3BD